ncbi:hypothetical protein [Pseudoalteromonas sp. 68 DY56-GL68]|uniref:hypothetical protein n=1 Tax=Pseudoalteromonas sp. 68 DY56-GL68 TaxID=2974919 RepID=UPI00352AD26B
MLKGGQLKRAGIPITVADLFLNIKQGSQALTTGSVYDLQAKWPQILAVTQSNICYLNCLIEEKK